MSFATNDHSDAYSSQRWSLSRLAIAIHTGHNHDAEHIQSREWRTIDSLLAHCPHLQSVELLCGGNIKAAAYDALVTEIQTQMPNTASRLELQVKRDEKVGSGRDLAPEMFGERWQKRYGGTT